LGVLQDICHLKERHFVGFEVLVADVVAAAFAFLALINDICVSDSIFKGEFSRAEHGGGGS